MADTVKPARPWSEETFRAAVAMPHWPAFVREVDRARVAIFEAAREREADRLASTMDMTPEGFVREWDRRGRPGGIPLEAWEHAYNRAGLVEAAERAGYLRIGRDVACTLTMEPGGEDLVATAHAPSP